MADLAKCRFPRPTLSQTELHLILPKMTGAILQFPPDGFLKPSEAVCVYLLLLWASECPWWQKKPLSHSQEKLNFFCLLKNVLSFRRMTEKAKKSAERLEMAFFATRDNSEANRGSMQTCTASLGLRKPSSWGWSTTLAPLDSLKVWVSDLIIHYILYQFVSHAIVQFVSHAVIRIFIRGVTGLCHLVREIIASPLWCTSYVTRAYRTNYNILCTVLMHWHN